jgi:hypothetical protein
LSYHKEDWERLAAKPVPAGLTVLLMVVATVVGFIMRGWFV